MDTIHAPALSSREVTELLRATAHLSGVERYRQLQFLFALVQHFKRNGATELPVPKSVLVAMPGAYSDTYQRRLELAEAAGLIAFTPRPGRAHGRRIRLELKTDTSGTFAGIDAALVRLCEVEWLSNYMRASVIRRGSDVAGAGGKRRAKNESDNHTNLRRHGTGGPYGEREEDETNTAAAVARK